jgi:hypothetical protein
MKGRISRKHKKYSTRVIKPKKRASGDNIDAMLRGM